MGGDVMPKRRYCLNPEDQERLINTHPQAVESHLMQCAKLAGLQIAPAAIRALATAAHNATLMHFSRAQVYFKRQDLLRVRDAQVFTQTTPDEIHEAAVAAGMSRSQVFRVLARERKRVR